MYRTLQIPGLAGFAEPLACVFLPYYDRTAPTRLSFLLRITHNSSVSYTVGVVPLFEFDLFEFDFQCYIEASAVIWYLADVIISCFSLPGTT